MLCPWVVLEYFYISSAHKIVVIASGVYAIQALFLFLGVLGDFHLLKG